MHFSSDQNLKEIGLFMKSLQEKGKEKTCEKYIWKPVCAHRNTIISSKSAGKGTQAGVLFLNDSTSKK